MTEFRRVLFRSYMRSVDADEMNIPDGWSLTHWISVLIQWVRLQPTR